LKVYDLLSMAETTFPRRLAPPLAVVAMMWALEVIDFILPGAPLDAFGIRPRTIAGLPGILFAPFLHGGFGHLIGNTIPLVVLGFLSMARRASDFANVFAWSMFVGGLGTWLFGLPNSIHIGASGVVFGLFGFLLCRGIFERSLGAIFMSLIAVVLYGGMLFSLIPVRYGISWSGHLFGFIGGMLAARALATRRSAIRV
jgi:membrane associated rhomboid family serine protease